MVLWAREERVDLLYNNDEQDPAVTNDGCSKEVPKGALTKNQDHLPRI